MPKNDRWLFWYNIINDENINNKIKMIYKNDKWSCRIRILGEEFVTNNKGNCKLVIDKKEYDICEYDKYCFNKNV